jgi:RNA polymerase sigma-70 factor (ECF subfamily)
VTHSDDLQLLEAWQGGDKAAGEKLFERHFDALFRFFRNKVRDGADDLVQQTFLACVGSRDRFRKEASFRTYLFRVAHSKLYDHLRANRRNDAIDFGVTSVADLGESPSAALVKDEEQRLLLQGLRLLPVDMQVLLELFYVERLRGPELARVLDLPEGTVRSRLRRGREMLREAVLARAADPESIEMSLADLDAWADRVRAAAFR